MAESPEARDRAGQARLFREMHQRAGMLVLPNAWDAASARAFVHAGFEAIATTSGGVANALGFEDHEGAPPDLMLGAAERIVAAVNVPVTVDFEAGYGLRPDEIAERLVGIGAAGLNIEDSKHTGGPGLVEAEEHGDRIASLRAAFEAKGSPLVINARVDVFILGRGEPEEQLQEGLRRARIYKDAGADCIYPITLSDPGKIAAFVEAVGTVNLNVRLGGLVSLHSAASLGVKRVSYATSIYREAMNHIASVSEAIQEETRTLSQKG